MKEENKVGGNTVETETEYKGQKVKIMYEEE